MKRQRKKLITRVNGAHDRRTKALPRAMAAEAGDGETKLQPI
jgi:hypothetical protein